MTRARIAIVAALGLALVALVTRAWVRVGEIEAELLAADIELA